MKPAASAPDALHEALAWQVTFWSGEVTDEERADLQCWLAASPDNARAWRQVQRTDEHLRGLARPAAAQALRSTPAPPRTSRRMLLALLAGGGAAAYTARQTSQWQVAMADHRTGLGERRELALPDGTRIMLGSATAIDVRYDPQRRQVRLLAGEIHITTAKDPAARPFVVRTRQGSVRALGTRFGVRQLDAWIQVAVEHGAVEIAPADGGPSKLLRLDAGQQTRFNALAAEPAQALTPNATAWARGLLVAERMSLKDFLAEVGRYRRGVLRADPAAQALVVSGVYSLDDTDHILATLSSALPIQVSMTTRWWVTISLRKNITRQP